MCASILEVPKPRLGEMEGEGSRPEKDVTQLTNLNSS